MSKFVGLSDKEWAVVEPLIPYKWGITFSGKQPLPLRTTSTGASGNERKEVIPLLKKISGWLKPIISRGITPIVEADKGYDAKELRLQILAMKLFPYIPYRRQGQHKLEPQLKVLEKYRWKAERGISWLQRKYRRLVVRWERRMKYWEGFLGLGILLYWVRELTKLGVCGEKTGTGFA